MVVHIPDDRFSGPASAYRLAGCTGDGEEGPEDDHETEPVPNDEGVS